MNQSSFEEEDDPDLEEDDPNIPLRRQDDEGQGDPESKGTVECLSRENKHIILEIEDDALVECTIQWLNMYDSMTIISKRESWKELPRKKKKKKKKKKIRR